MRNLILCLCVAVSGCAGHRKCCATVGCVAALVGIGAVLSVAENEIDKAIDPEPPTGPTLKKQKEHFDWEQRQIDEDGNFSPPN
jgi:hypothetical protein